MRLSQLFTHTSKTVPADEVSKNAQLLIRAGFIHKEMAGIYSYLPLGKKVLNNISGIIRDELADLGCQEVQMSILQSKELWQKTNRWDDKVVDNWFKSRLANGQEVGIGLTHEEPIANALIPFVNSYKELPVYVYQIQSKFRNELRAKSGIMRCREFLMKDLYSFSRNQKEHEQFYEKAANSYMNIYKKLGIGDITVRTFASGGYFSKYSDEFQTISDIGEDTIYIDESKNIAINKEVLKPEVLKDLGLSRESLVEKKAVEVGNIFSLGTKYADDVGLYFVDENDKRNSVIMGCYGIGISRLMGLIAEHFADDKGLVWPKSIAPALVYLISIGDSADVVSQADKAYNEIKDARISVIYDDRNVSAGEKFADADLLGIPFRVVISSSTAKEGAVELKSRESDDAKKLKLEELIKSLAR